MAAAAFEVAVAAAADGVDENGAMMLRIVVGSRVLLVSLLAQGARSEEPATGRATPPRKKP